MGAFFHGVKINEKSSGAVPINVVQPGIIGLVGTAPSWAVESPLLAPAPNAPILVSSELDAAQFGPLVQGYSIPYALAAILAQAKPGAVPQVIVIDVFDPTAHYTTLTSQAFTFPASGPQVINLGHMGISKTSTPGKPVVKNTAGDTTYVEGVDYTVDYVNGLITALGSPGTIATNESVKVTFSYNDPSKVDDSDIIGAITDGVYTGIQALETTYLTMGFFAKILIAPGYSDNEDVAAAMITIANTIRGRALIDSAPTTSRATAISNRTGSNAFATSSYRAYLCWPCVQFTDNGLVPTGVTVSTEGTAIQDVDGETSVAPRSAYDAGEWSALVGSVGPWASNSNKEVNGVLGPDIGGLYVNPGDPNSDAELANAAGIVAMMSSFATGWRVWGNRSAAFPTYTDPAVFNCIRLMMDVIEDSEVESMLQFIDLPLTSALIYAIIESINGFLREFIIQGGLIDGNCSFNSAENPAVQLEAGMLVLDDEYMPPPPLEQLILNSIIQPDFLSELATQVAAAQQS